MNIRTEKFIYNRLAFLTCMYQIYHDGGEVAAYKNSKAEIDILIKNITKIMKDFVFNNQSRKLNSLKYDFKGSNYKKLIFTGRYQDINSNEPVEFTCDITSDLINDIVSFTVTDDRHRLDANGNPANIGDALVVALKTEILPV